MRYTTRPLSDRTALTGEHEASRFTVRYSDALDLLERELMELDATDIVIEVDVDERAIRLDGQLRADAKAKSPGVRIAFESSVGPLTFATDAFVRGGSWAYVGTGDSRKRRDTMTQDWQHNLYAIAKSLEALRMVDRYGVTKRGEQYVGLKALPAGRAMPASHMTADQARDVITSILGPVDRPWDTRIRMAKAEAHPDRNGGDRTLWDQVEQAATVLGATR